MGKLIVILAALAAAVVAGLLLVGIGGSDSAAVVPPVAERGAPALTIPDGALRLDAQSREPIEDPDARWVRSAGRRLTPLLGRCEPRSPASIAARQVALVDVTLWKAERLTVYRDAAAAQAVIAGVRRCNERRDGERAWMAEPLAGIGDEALFVGSLRTRDGRAKPGAHRGIVARAGRAIVWFVDYGPGARRMPRLDDLPRYPGYARDSARRLATAAWLT